MIQKFFVLGILSTLLDYAVYVLAMLLGLDYILAIVLGYSLGLWANFGLGRKYVFKHGSKVKSVSKELFYILIIAVGGIVINIAIVYVLTYNLELMDALYSRIVAIMVSFVWNYVLRRVFVYY
ncbi:MAG: hypothetical protein DRQ78_01745 [Epsilonproteobacteria bacterium]|nr:MAG: hypothetical protein DRQ78_01745 [Campylobacterota bacterium]